MLHRSTFDPRRATASQRHIEVYIHYRRVYVTFDCAAALAFIAGSICFLYESLQEAAAWLFIIGSVLFAAVPIISIVQGIHLGKLPVPSGKQSISD